MIGGIDVSRKRIILGGLALIAAPTILAQSRNEPPPASGPALSTPMPNPVPPQFRGQPVNPPTTYPGNPTFRPTQPPVGTINTNQPPAPVWPTPSESLKQEAVTEPRPIVVPTTPTPAPVAPTNVAPIKAPTTAITPPMPATPTVMVEKRGPETLNAGSALIYEIVVRNLGQTLIEQVRVEDELPGGTRYVTSNPPAEAAGDRLAWNLGQLESNAERKLRVEVMPNADGEYRATARVTFCASTAMRTAIVRPQLALQMSAPDQANAGDQVPFQILVSNPGTGPVNNLVLRVKLPPGLQHPQGSHIEADLGSLPAGGTKTIPLRVTAVAGGIQVNDVSATGEGGLEASARSQVSVMQPQLQLRRSGPAKVMFKGEVTEELEVNNPGNAPANNVNIIEVLPPGLEFVGATDGALYDPVGRSVTWRLGQQPPGSVRKVVLKAKAVAVGDQSTRAVAVAERGLEAKADGVVAVEGIPALLLEVGDLEDPVEVGGDLTYEVRVVNQGSCPCTNIRIVCDVPEGLTPTEATGPAMNRVVGTQVIFDPMVKLATKADAVYRIKVRGTLPGDYRFKVQMTCDQLRLPVNKEESSRVYGNNP